MRRMFGVFNPSLGRGMDSCLILRYILHSGTFSTAQEWRQGSGKFTKLSAWIRTHCCQASYTVWQRDLAKVPERDTYIKENIHPIALQIFEACMGTELIPDQFFPAPRGLRKEDWTHQICTPWLWMVAARLPCWAVTFNLQSQKY